VYKGDLWKGGLLFGATIGCLVLAIDYDNNYTNNNHRYLISRGRYADAETAENTVYWAGITQKNYDKAKDAARTRDIFLYSAIGIYALNIIDALIFDPAGGYREEKEIDLQKELNVSAGDNIIQISYTIEF